MGGAGPPFIRVRRRARAEVAGRRAGRRPAGSEDGVLANALRLAANPAFITDASGRIAWVNRAFTEHYGRSERSVIGKTPSVLQSGRQGPRYYAALWRAIRNGHPWAEEIVDRRADGSLCTVLQTITPLRGANGDVTHFLAIHCDVSKRVEAAAIAQAQQVRDQITGLHTRAAFEAHCRDVLEREGVLKHRLDFMLIGVEHHSGGVPRFDAHAETFVSGVIGARLRRVLGPDAVVGALGPFDFAILMPDDRPANEALRPRLAEVLLEPFPLLGDTLRLTCYCGFARFPDEGRDLHTLRRVADGRIHQQQPHLRAAQPAAGAALA